MNVKLSVAVLLLAAAPAICSAQNSQKTKIKTKDDGTVKIKTEDAKVKYKSTPPEWANAHSYQNDMHVYFPDYYTYYDPSRGYIYWNGDTWTTSSTIPSFMSTVDMNAARLQMLNDVPVSDPPEIRYSDYMRQYPAQPVQGVTITTPPIR